MSSAAQEIPHAEVPIVSDDGRFVRVALDDAYYELLRLRWAERNRAVHRSVHVNDGTVDVDPMAFAEALLAASLVAVVRGAEREEVTTAWLADMPVALGDRLLSAAVRINRRAPIEVSEVPRESQRVDVYIGDVVYTLAAWSWGMRNRALMRAAARTRDGRRAMDAVAFHEDVLRAMCVAIDGQEPARSWLAALDADVGDALLDTALRMSGIDRAQQAEIARDLRVGRAHDAVTLYTLCKEFGWTPSQVRDQRAADIDALLAVRNATAAPAPAPPHAAASQPGRTWREDETVILITDHEEDAR